MDKCKKQPDIDITEVGAGRKCSGLDLISRQAAIDACLRVRELRAYDEIEEIKALPSAEPKTGKWMQTATMNIFECSCCHSRWNIHYVSDFDYCPHCGTKMEDE